MNTFLIGETQTTIGPLRYGKLSKLVKLIRFSASTASKVSAWLSLISLQIRRLVHQVKQRCKGFLKMSGPEASRSTGNSVETLAKSCAAILLVLMVSCCLGSNAQLPLDHLSHFNPCPFNPQCQCSTGGKLFFPRNFLWNLVEVFRELGAFLSGLLRDVAHKSCTQMKTKWSYLRLSAVGLPRA